MGALSMLTPVRAKVSDLALGEPLITDLLNPAPTISQETYQSTVKYMSNMIKFMHETGSPPNTERIDVNHEGLVLGGNHRVLAAWLLGWSYIDCFQIDRVAGWRVPLDNDSRIA